MTDTTATAIRTAAAEYNKDYPEALAEIEAGEPVLRIIGAADSRTGWTIRATATYGIRTQDGHFIASDVPFFLSARRRSGTETVLKAAAGLHRTTVKAAKAAGITVEVVDATR